jgi:hypothetical protein
MRSRPLDVVGYRSSLPEGPAISAGTFEIRQVSVRVLRIAGLSPLFDDDLQGLALVFVQHVVDGSGRRRSDTPRTAATARQAGEGDNRANEDDEPRNGFDHDRAEELRRV